MLLRTFNRYTFKNVLSQKRIHVPKQYSNIHDESNPSSWDYENYQINFGVQDDYEIFERIGRGKYSEVFNGINVLDNTERVIKILKPNQMKKIQREVMILEKLKEHPNIVQLEDVVQDQGSKNISLIFEKIENMDFKSNYDVLKLRDIKHIIREVLIGLEYAHSKGIFHRDIKPQNIIIDKEIKTVKIIDWGLAEFFLLSKDYNFRVASRYFKGPELLVDFRYYDYSLDIWSLGCVLGGIIFKQEPLFRGMNNDDQLIKICKQLGTSDLYNYLNKYQIELPERYKAILKKYCTSFSKKSFDQLINIKNQDLCVDEAIDLISRMLVMDHAERITPAQALQHPFLI